MLARHAPQSSSKADTGLSNGRDRFTPRHPPRGTNPAVLLFRPEPT